MAKNRWPRAHGDYGSPAPGAGRGVPALERSRVLPGSCEGLEEPFPAGVCLGSGECGGGVGGRRFVLSGACGCLP